MAYMGSSHDQWSHLVTWHLGPLLSVHPSGTYDRSIRSKVQAKSQGVWYDGI